jgi:hypothetical protein
MEKAMMKVISSISFHRVGDLSLEAPMSLVWEKIFIMRDRERVCSEKKMRMNKQMQNGVFLIITALTRPQFH